MTLESRISQWRAERQRFRNIGGIGKYIEYVLEEDPEWYTAFGEEVGLNPERTYDSRAMDWHKRVTNQLIDVLYQSGVEFRDVIFTTPDKYVPGSVKKIFESSAKGFVVIDPGPKSIEDTRWKLMVEGVKDYSHIFDYQRVTLIGANIEECRKMQDVLIGYFRQYEFFAPLTLAERTMKNGKVVPSLTDFGNALSAPELLEMVRSGNHYAKTLRFQIGPEVIGKEFFNYASEPPHILHRNPPSGMRVTTVIMTPDLFEFLNDPDSPAHHSHYAKRTQTARGLNF